MKPRISRRRRMWRLLAPGAVLSLALAGCGVGGGATPGLPETSAPELLAALQRGLATPLSGTILAQVSLGLPAATAARLSTLPDGAHTMRLWYAGPDRLRVALFGVGMETDVFRTGRTLWRWDSKTRVATRAALPQTLPGSLASLVDAPMGFPAFAPGPLCRRVLDSLDERTGLDVRPGRRIADHPTYKLVLTPGDENTRVSSVRIEVDGRNKVPLGVQVYARHVADPVLDVAYTSITFKRPADGYFSFTPPPGATVAVAAPATSGPDPSAPRLGVAPTRTLGEGWSAVAEYRSGKRWLTADPAAGDGAAIPQAADYQPIVMGDWGAGRLLVTPLLCALETSAGVVYAGLVDPSVLYAAAAERH